MIPDETTRHALLEQVLASSARPSHKKIAAIILSAGIIERPVIPDCESKPTKSTSGRRQAAGAEDPSLPPFDPDPALPGPAAGPDEGFPADDSSLPASASEPRNPGDDIDGLKITLAECAQLDHSDTDNGERLRKYFGNMLTVRSESEVAGGSFLSWCGTHWDLDGGAAGASMIAQKVGPLIMREAEYLQPTPSEAAAIAAGDKARTELKSAIMIAEERQEELEDLVAAARAVVV
jgi:putative DNA primase/helicase